MNTPHERFVAKNRINKTRGWAVFNWGIFWSFGRTQREAIEEAEACTGEAWSKLKHHCEVRKVEIVLEKSKGDTA